MTQSWQTAATPCRGVARNAQNAMIFANLSESRFFNIIFNNHVNPKILKIGVLTKGADITAHGYDNPPPGETAWGKHYRKNRARHALPLRLFAVMFPVKHFFNITP